MEKCARCRVDGKEVRLYDGIYQSKMSKICERCAILENVLIIKKPQEAQLRASEKSLGVYERMKVIANPKDAGRKAPPVLIRDRLREIEKKPMVKADAGKKPEMVDYYHWVLMRYRRKKGLTQEQLAEQIQEPLASVVAIEKGELPDGSEEVLKKLEKFFQIQLIKRAGPEHLIKDSTGKQRTSPVLLDEEGRELEKIPEPNAEEVSDGQEPKKKVGFFKMLQEKVSNGLLGKEPQKEVLEQKVGAKEEAAKKEPPKLSGDLNLRDIDTKEIKIADLRELHRKKIEATKQEKTEEKMRIQERQKLIEARKEELRMMKEKQSREIDNLLGGKELLEKDDSFEDELR